MITTDNNRYLCFSVANEEFGIPLLNVKEVIGYPDITPVPQTPSHFLGIMNLRGNVISVLDMRLKIGQKATKSEETTVMILDLGGFNLGVVVDCVNSVIAVQPDQLSPRPVIESSKNTEYISNVYRRDDRLILFIDIAKALSVDDYASIKKQAKTAA
jgi:purine-binding chemotaxis protein CheW